MSTKITVMGSGSWGTAFALVLADAGNEVTMWARRPQLAAVINDEHRNPDYHAHVVLPDAVRAVSDASEALASASVVVLAVPSQTLRPNLASWDIPSDAVLLSLAKGIETGTGLRMTQVVHGVTGIPDEQIGVLSGPNLAGEIAARQPSASVVASTDHDTAVLLQKLCHTATFRPYTHTDVIGTELAGATKNVIALAVGMGIGLGFGANAQASVITRGLAETSRLGLVLGAEPQTFAGLAGLGDLVATCSSPLSRNRTFGEGLGRGHTVAEIVASTRQIAEGVKSCASIQQLASEHGVEMPIVEQVAEVISGALTPSAAITKLLSRSPRPEWD